MALFVPLIVGLPIGYFTWAKVFDFADNKITSTIYKKNEGKMKVMGAIFFSY